MRIVIYDSGVGGLSIYQEVYAVLPEHEYIFLSDNQAFPYGTKSEQELLARVHAVTVAIVDHYAPDLIIVACNTASTLALDSLRNAFDLHFIGVVPAIKPAAQITQTGHIAVLATPATVGRAYTHKLIEDHAQGCQVDLIAAPAMVGLAEAKLRGETVDMQALERMLDPIKSNPQIDTLVLACTHFPLLRQEIEAVLGSESHVKYIIDSAAAIARRANTVLQDLLVRGEEEGSSRNVDGQAAKEHQNSALFTRLEQWSPEFLAYLEKLGFHQIDYISV